MSRNWSNHDKSSAAPPVIMIHDAPVPLFSIALLPPPPPLPDSFSYPAFISCDLPYIRVVRLAAVSRDRSERPASVCRRDASIRAAREEERALRYATELRYNAASSNGTAELVVSEF